MQRILICARAYPPNVAGGGEISTALIAGGLRQLGLDVSVLTFGYEAVEEVRQSVPIRRLASPPIYWSFDSDSQPAWKKVAWHLNQSLRSKPISSVQRAISEIQPDLVHTSTLEDFGPGIWPWCRSLSIPTVHTLRSYQLLHRGATLYDADRDCDRRRDALSYPKQRRSRSVNGVIGISQSILERHLQAGFFPRSLTGVIANPIADPIANPIAAPIVGGEKRLTGDSIRLGILGRISPEKGMEPFLNALRSLNSEYSWSLQIAGDGPSDYVSHLQRASQGLPVEWLGWQESRSFLRGIDLLVVPSRWQEPFGRIVVEAYSVGLPVLCLQRGGLSELVIEEQTGWSTPEWHADVIVHAMKHCRTLDPDRIRSEAEKYTVERIATEHRKFYELVYQHRDAFFSA